MVQNDVFMRMMKSSGDFSVTFGLFKIIHDERFRCANAAE